MLYLFYPLRKPSPPVRTLSTIEKGRLTSSSIRTRRLSLPIISSLKALLARRLFHPRTPTRSFVSLLTACLLELGSTALIFARFYVSPPGRIQPASGFAGKHPL